MEADLKAALLAAYARLLRPLVQILLRNGVSYSEFAETAKRVFVTTAATRLRTRGTSVTAAQIAIQIGLSQRETQEVIDGQSTPPVNTNLAWVTSLLTAWHSDDRVVGPYGLPLELQLQEPGRMDFETLVRDYCPGAKPGPLLNQLVAIGAVRQTDDGWLRVLTRTYLPAVDEPDSVERIGYFVQRLVETVDFNRQQSDPNLRLFERTVTADFGLKEEDLPALEGFIRQRGQQLLEEIDNWITLRDKPDLGRGDRAVQTGLGIYHYVENSDD
ncbi:MAG: hypothetical protein E4H19_00255 [Chromatiales bacterium]|nr:MAG: hypothetical protein E4H19_00255 [Chromatiales bacterium]